MAKKRRDRRETNDLLLSHEEVNAKATDPIALTVSHHDTGGSTRMSLLLLLAIFTCSASVMYLVYRNFPELQDDEMEKIKIPKDMDDAKALGTVLSKYKDTYYSQVLVAYFATYIFLQTFAIPGSIFLSILSGYLYPFPLALFLVCLCSGLGASFCYLLSYLVGRPVVYKYLTEKAQKWSQQVDKHRDHLINYIIFLRITPFLPNWFINITSPVINVPLGVFFVGTFLGVAPPSFVAINAGTTLYKLTTAEKVAAETRVDHKRPQHLQAPIFPPQQRAAVALDVCLGHSFSKSRWEVLPTEDTTKKS
ncbi:transmembrane protein 41B isoform X1 [Stigmatopora nigra]